MPNSGPRHPISPEQINREDHLKEKYEQARSVISKIENRIKPFKYGINASDLNKEYKFVSADDSKSFFKSYFGQTEAASDINQMHIDRCNKLTLNRSNTRDGSLNSIKLFENVFSKLLEKIDALKVEKKPLLRIVVGPTGAGKTAFSKGLITACIRNFWDNNIIPCRIEYSRFVELKSELCEEELVSYIRQCQLRDLLIWIFFSNKVSANEVSEALSSIEGVELKRKITKLEEMSQKHNFGQDNSTLKDINDVWRDAVGYLNDDESTNHVLNLLNNKFSMSFFISIDGFDVVNVEDFLISNKTPAPIDAVVRLLQGILRKLVKQSHFTRDFECHFILYLRDTTYHRLKLELNKSVGGVNNIPRNWIVPPTYKNLVQKVAGLVGSDIQPNLPISPVDEFANTIGKLFDQHILRDFKDKPVRPISGVFGWNARYMKRHVGRMLFCSFDDLTNNDDFKARIKRAGAGEKWLWDSLISNSGLQEMSSYRVLEELFLDNSRQLRPKLNLSSSMVADFLKEGNLKEAIGCIDDYGETVGFFDCILNYALKINLADGTKYGCVSGCFVTVRVLQFIKQNSKCNMHQIRDFLDSLGYRISIAELTFLLYLFIRNEIVTWRSSENVRVMGEAQLSITFMGDVILDKMFFSVSYFSECLCIAELPINGLSSELLNRDFSSNKKWIINCAFNSIIGFNILKLVEEIELQNLADSDIQYNNYSLVYRFRQQLKDEISKIFNSVGRSRKSWPHIESIERKLQALSDQYTYFENIREIEYG